LKSQFAEQLSEIIKNKEDKWMSEKQEIESELKKELENVSHDTQ